MHRFTIAALIAMGAAAAVPSAHGSEALSPSVAQRLDRQAAEYTMTEAKRERLMIIQETMARQRHYERSYGYRDGYGGAGYGRPYGPPPYAPAYGYPPRPRYDRW